MIGRKVPMGFSLLCILIFFVFAAQSALAKGTTAFTCVEKTAEAGFADEHCDNAASGASVEFVHKEIKPKLPTGIAISNEKTTEETKGAATTITRFTLSGLAVEFECTKASGTGGVENKEVEKVMQGVGTSQIEYTGCTVAKPSPCKVKEPIVQSNSLTTYEAGENEMGVELSPKEKGIFATIAFEGEKCSLKGAPLSLTGSAQGTPGGSPNGPGATLTFTEGMGSISIGEKPVTLISTITLGTKGFGLPENPVAFTTTE